MTKEEFMNKHNLTELDYRNLVRFNQGLDLLNITEESIDDYIKLVVKNNINGGKKSVDIYFNNYEEFLDTLTKRYLK